MNPSFSSPASKSSALGLALCLLLASVAHSPGQISATAQLSSASIGGGEFQYTLTLNNTGSLGIETFWNAWVPGEDFMFSNPTDIVSPANWSATITHAGSGDGYAIEWTTTSAALNGGSSLQFSFESTDTPEALAGNSVFFTSTPVETSLVSSAPFLGGSEFEFVAQSIPEPSTVALSLLGAVGLLCAGRRRFGFSP